MQEPKLTTKNEKFDPKVQKTLEVVSNLKALDPTMTEVVKATQKYVEYMSKVSEAAKSLADMLGILADQHGGDLGDGIRQVSDTLKQLEAKRWKFASAVGDKLVEPYLRGDQRRELAQAEVNNFARQYQGQRGASLKTIKRGETQCRKLAKKKKRDQNALDNALSDLSKSIESHDNMLADNLRQIIRIDRKRFCTYIQNWNEVMINQAEGFAEGSELIAEKLPVLQRLALTTDAIPESQETLIRESRPETALEQLRSARATGYYSGGLTLGDDDGYDTMGRNSPGPAGGSAANYDDPLGGHPVAPYKVRVKQRYDAQNPDEVSLVLGDIFDVYEEIDENWAIAEIHGHRGMFPSNHVEKMRRAGS